MMFRTRLDQELKIQNSSGSPFYDLRESISIILNEHVKEPQVQLEKFLPSFYQCLFHARHLILAYSTDK